MPFWSCSISCCSSSTWTKEAASAMPALARKGDCENGHDSGMPPTTSTALDGGLPAPVLQNSTTASSTHSKKKSVRLTWLPACWASFTRRIGSGTAPSTSSLIGDTVDSNHTHRAETGQEKREVVDEIVVDRGWSDEMKSSIYHSEHGASPEKSGSNPQVGSIYENLYVHDGFWSLWFPLVILRWRVWPKVEKFFCSRFSDEKAEQHYTQVDSTFTPSLIYHPSQFPKGTLVFAQIARPLVFGLAHCQLGSCMWLRR
jgi:osomolarity two-component system sensor histidine kinase SLN1